MKPTPDPPSRTSRGHRDRPGAAARRTVPRLRGLAARPLLALLVAAASLAAPGCAARRDQAATIDAAGGLGWLRRGLDHADAGRADRAIAAFERAADEEALAGWALVLAAREAARTGAADRALELLERAQGRGHHLPLATLRADPAFAPLFGHPRATGLRGYEFVQRRLGAGREVEQVVLTPRIYRPDRASPVLVALADDPADRQAVERGLLRLWGRQATERGWIVISPADRDPPGAWLVDVVTAVRAPPEGVWIAGVEQGAARALRLARDEPRLVAGVILVGDAPGAVDLRDASRLAGLPVLVFVGDRDPDLPRVERAVAALAGAGADVRVERLREAGDWPLALAGGRLVEAAGDAGR